MGKIDLMSIKSSISMGLINEYEGFITSTMDFFEANKDSYIRLAFEEISDKQPPFFLNYEFAKKFIQEAISGKSEVQLRSKIGDGYPWYKNEIKFSFGSKIPEPPTFGSVSFLKYSEWRDELEYICEEEFWEIPKFQEEYKQFESINIFDDFIFEENKLSQYQKANTFFLSKKKWKDYISSLIGCFFPEFSKSASLSAGSVKRYFTPINGDILFGFEYDEAALNYEMSKGQPEMPQYFNIIIVSKEIKGAIKGLRHWQEGRSDILSLGILGNPFFFPPCYSVLGYSAVDRHRQLTIGLPYKREIVKFHEGMYQIVHPGRYNESIKKHAFFYMHMLSVTALPYIHYLINSVERSCRL